MERFYRAVVRHPKMVIALFLVCLSVSLALSPLVGVNYNVADFLPADTISTRAIEVMTEQYDTGVPNARALARDVSVAEALALKSALAAIDGIDAVMWLDDEADILQPVEYLDPAVVARYYAEGDALFSLTIQESKAIAALADVRALLGEDAALSGGAVSTAEAKTSTIGQVQIISLCAVAFVIVMLLLTTTSWMDPLVVLLSLGVAIGINMGTNLIFGTVSFVTDASGAVLQLAVSLDYSIFLLHRFDECRRECADAKEAMVQALCRSTSSILSSGLTTVIGFLALCLMKFLIGPDLGLALAKGVAISLITVLVFTPVLILTLLPGIDKARHRSFMPSWRGLGQLIRRLMIPMVTVFAIVVLPSYLAAQKTDYYYGAAYIFGEDTEVGRDAAEINSLYGKETALVLMVPRNETARELALSAQVQKIPQVTGVTSWVDTAGATIPPEYVDASIREMLLSDEYSRMVINLAMDVEGAEPFEVVADIRALAEEYFPGEWLMAGEAASTYDLMVTIQQDMLLVNLVAVGAVFVVLLLSMRSVVLPFILVLCIEGAIWLNTAVPYFMGQHVFYISYLIISSVQLGATVDYAILFTDRYMEFRRQLPKREALVITVQTVTTSILTSGLTMTVVGLLMGFVSTHQILAQLGMFMGRGTLLSMISVFFVLPGMLYLLDGLIRRGTLGAGAHADTTTEMEGTLDA
ncbi:MAG: MMPL family transporter [Clostridia bacterium]|nr:MMPL family transporter [Clostridia bacterium]